jgi:hypothetical protein
MEDLDAKNCCAFCHFINEVKLALQDSKHIDIYIDTNIYYLFLIPRADLLVTLR